MSEVPDDSLNQLFEVGSIYTGNARFLFKEWSF